MIWFIGITLLLALGLVVFMVTKEVTENNNNDDLERITEMSKEIKFLLRNSPNFKNARQYIENTCDCYDIKDYEFKPFYEDQICLWVKIDKTQHIIFLDYETLEIKMILSSKPHTKILVK